MREPTGGPHVYRWAGRQLAHPEQRDALSTGATAPTRAQARQPGRSRSARPLIEQHHAGGPRARSGKRRASNASPPSARGLSPPGVEERRPEPRQMRRAPPSGTRGGRSAAPGARAGGPPQAGRPRPGGAEAAAPAERRERKAAPRGGGGEARRSDGRARQPRSGLPRASIPR